MEKFDYERFGIEPVNVELRSIKVTVGNSKFSVYGVELQEFIMLCLGSGLDVRISSADNDFLIRS